MQNIIIAGLGGQGILTCSDIFANIALEMGLDVKVSEVHGMAQRGGTVQCHIVMGEKVYSPVIDYGCADILVVLDASVINNLEQYLKEDGEIVFIKDLAHVDSFGGFTHELNVVEYDSRVWSKRCINFYVLGYLCRKYRFKNLNCRKVLLKNEAFLSNDANDKAFKSGYGLKGVS